MKLKITYLTLLVLILISSESLAQWEGYIVWNDNVSRTGYVKIDKRNASQVEFYTHPEGEATIIGAEEILEVGYDKRLGYDARVFNPIDVRFGTETQKELSELLVNGELKLYKSLQSKTFFIETRRRRSGGWIWAPRKPNKIQLGERNSKEEIRILANRGDYN